MKESDIRSAQALDTYLEMVRQDCRRLFGDAGALLPVACPACGSSRSTLQFTKDSFEYGLCEDCETLYARTRPSFSALQDFYTQSPSTRYWINDFFKPVAEARREKIFRPRAEYLRERLGSDPGWVIGDVGAGFGLFCLELQKIWPRSRCFAIEPSLEQEEICRKAGLEVVRASLEELGVQEDRSGSFDLLTVFELYEHLHDPREFTRAAHLLLKPGGRMLVTTLNGQGFDIQVLWEQSISVYPPCHINLFNPDSLAGLLCECGFEVEEIATPGQLDWDILERMIDQEGSDPGRFWASVAKRASAQAKEELQNWITRNHFSSHMRLLARKPLDSPN